MSDTPQTDRRKNDCCNATENLTRQDTGEDTYVETCKLCGSKHYVIVVDPLVVGVVV